MRARCTGFKGRAHFGELLFRVRCAASLGRTSAQRHGPRRRRKAKTTTPARPRPAAAPLSVIIPTTASLLALMTLEAPRSTWILLGSNTSKLPTLAWVICEGGGAGRGPTMVEGPDPHPDCPWSPQRPAFATSCNERAEAGPLALSQPEFPWPTLRMASITQSSRLHQSHAPLSSACSAGSDGQPCHRLELGRFRVSMQRNPSQGPQRSPWP